MISLEPYAPNIVRVTMSTDRAAATGAPGYGFVAKPSAEGWTHERDAEGTMCTDPPGWWCAWRRKICRRTSCRKPMPLDALNLELREHYFGGGGGNGPNDGGMVRTTMLCW